MASPEDHQRSGDLLVPSLVHQLLCWVGIGLLGLEGVENSDALLHLPVVYCVDSVERPGSGSSATSSGSFDQHVGNPGVILHLPVTYCIYYAEPPGFPGSCSGPVDSLDRS